MTAEQLEELQRLVDSVDNDTVDPYDGVSPYFAASLARRVIELEKRLSAAERLVDVAERMFEDPSLADVVSLQLALTAYREASK